MRNARRKRGSTKIATGSLWIANLIPIFGFSILLFVSDYCLTTIFPKLEKPLEPRCAKGFHGFCKSVLILCNVPETRMKPGFSPWRPDNSDSVGRWFESSRAHQNLQRNGSLGGFLLPIITLKKIICTRAEIWIWRLWRFSVVGKIVARIGSHL